MRRNKRDFGRLILIAIFLFVAVLLPNLINAISRAAGTLGTFAAGETGIKLCATISGGNEDALRFNVTNNQGFQADVVVPADTCKNIHTEAATYHVRQYVSQEYAIDSVSGGTISADNSDFIATASGQYSIIYANTYSQKPYLHNFGYTSSATASSAVEVTFDANGGTGTMAPQNFGLNSQQTLTANAFTRTGFSYDGWNTKADGTGTSYTNGQALTFSAGGELKLYAQWHELATLYNTITSLQNNGVDTTVDFTTAATVATGNGNGLNIRSGTENDDYPVYYFRGEVDNNNVIWADICWKVVRTTDGGGTKMIYSGLSSDVEVDGETVKQCNATGVDKLITYNNNKYFRFNDSSASPADMGYMYGARIESSSLSADNTSFTFSNNVSRNGNIYTLDTSTGQSISGTWANERTNAAVRYHYFCTDGATSCDNTKIGYIHYFAYSNTIYYLKVDGYDGIESMKAAMFANITDSNAKMKVEAWFEQQNLDGHETGTRNYEDDLEDTVFCNDRSYFSGALKGKDSDATPRSSQQSVITEYSFHGAYVRNEIKNADNSYEPSLDCMDPNDAFTTDPANGNGKLNHKIGLITSDELTIAGSGKGGYDATAYLYTINYMGAWSASPEFFGAGASGVYWGSYLGGNPPTSTFGLRPLVSLKSEMKILDNGADGTTANPYIVE